MASKKKESLMTTPISNNEQSAVIDVVKQMENAWNAGDANGFAAPMAENVDFITIRADHLYGRQAVIDSHVDVLSTFYAGSTNHFNITDVRLLGADVALAQIRAVLESPSGPLKGTREATYSLVLYKESGHWQVALFYITLATPTPEH